jgi:hypothetical protein
MLIDLKLQLVDQDQMDGYFDSLLCVSEAFASFVLPVDFPQRLHYFTQSARGGIFPLDLRK